MIMFERFCVLGQSWTLDSKTIKDTVSEFTESMLDMELVFEFELMDRWVPKEPESVCSVVKDA
jgi:hypothetical protein